MAILKCKICGGDLEIDKEMSVCTCQYCGVKQTVPKYSDDMKINRMNRANRYRRQYDFDKAIEQYELILQDTGEDAEVYWNLVLCRYGIEYVDDPLTKKKIPTCHRMQYVSITDDPDYKMSLTVADANQKEIITKSAEEIAGIQKGILEISGKEEPFDVFICYKDTDAQGNRTKDSVLAQEIYDGLTGQGLKVFFSRITLEGKLGTAYEPYIFAALNSAKIMIVVATCSEYVSSVWVKNEWSRFLELMKEDKDRHIIPAYRDMDPYDLPDSLAIYQSLDMSKLGFMQDLIRGVKKLITPLDSFSESSNSGRAVQALQGEYLSNADSLLKRGFLALEDKEWEDASAYFNQVLNMDAECSRAYFGLFLSSRKMTDSDKYISYVTSHLDEFEADTYTAHLSEEQIQNIKKSAQENGLKDFAIKEGEAKEYVCKIHYKAIEKKKREIENILSNDKYLSKAVRFLKAGEKDEVGELKTELLKRIDAELEPMREKDLDTINRLNEQVENDYEKILGRIKKEFEEKENEYNRCVYDYDAGLMKDSYSYKKNAFLKFGDYKEAKSYISKIEKEYSGKKERLSQLESDVTDYKYLIMTCNAFSRKKREQYEMKLNRVYEEMETIKKSLQ